MKNDSQREAAILEATLQLRARDKQLAYLAEACAGDSERRQRLEARLQERLSAGAGPPPPLPPLDFASLPPAPGPKRYSPWLVFGVAAMVLLIAMSLVLFRNPTVSKPQPQGTRAKEISFIPPQPDTSPASATSRAKGVKARACFYDFSARVKTMSGAVYNLSKVQTLSRFPFPQPVKENFGRLLVMAWAPTNSVTQAAPAPCKHFWLSKLKRLRNVGSRLEIVTTSGQTFISEQGWLSNYRHKRYPHENKDTSNDVIIGLTDAGQIGLDTLEIEEIEFTTDEREISQFELDLQAVLPPRQPAVLRFEKRTVPAERFFFIDAAGSWFKTDFLHLWWPGGLEFTIWHDSGQGKTNFWDLPQVPVVKSEVKTIQFGPAPDLIQTKVVLRTGAELSGYFVTHTESQKGAWQWEQGREGYWDSVVVFTEDGLDVYAMFPGGPRFAELAQEVGPLTTIAFEEEPPEKKSQ